MRCIQINLFECLFFHLCAFHCTLNIRGKAVKCRWSWHSISTLLVWITAICILLTTYLLIRHSNHITHELSCKYQRELTQRNLEEAPCRPCCHFFISVFLWISAWHWMTDECVCFWIFSDERPDEGKTRRKLNFFHAISGTIMNWFTVALLCNTISYNKVIWQVEIPRGLSRRCTHISET